MEKKEVKTSVNPFRMLIACKGINYLFQQDYPEEDYCEVNTYKPLPLNKVPVLNIDTLSEKCAELMNNDCRINE